MNKRGNEISKKPTVSHPESIAIQFLFLLLIAVAMKTKQYARFTEYSTRFSKIFAKSTVVAV